MASFQKEKAASWGSSPGQRGGRSACHALGRAGRSLHRPQRYKLHHHCTAPATEVGRGGPEISPRRSPPHRVSTWPPPCGLSTLDQEMTREKRTISPRRKRLGAQPHSSLQR